LARPLPVWAGRRRQRPGQSHSGTAPPARRPPRRGSRAAYAAATRRYQCPYPSRRGGTWRDAGQGPALTLPNLLQARASILPTRLCFACTAFWFILVAHRAIGHLSQHGWEICYDGSRKRL
jgi:hypothetical protein